MLPNEAGRQEGYVSVGIQAITFAEPVKHDRCCSKSSPSIGSQFLPVLL